MGSCSTSRLALFWGDYYEQPANTLRQRLREFYLEPKQKRGEKRKEIDPTLCFAPLLRWVLAFSQNKRLALAMDATNINATFALLYVSVLWGRCAVPVAWKVLPKSEKGEWKSQWFPY